MDDRRPWTDDEDRMVVDLVHKYGVKKWALIGQAIGPGRTGKQCRERWHNHLNPEIKKDAWGADEDTILINAHNCRYVNARFPPGGWVRAESLELYHATRLKAMDADAAGEGMLKYINSCDSQPNIALVRILKPQAKPQMARVARGERAINQTDRKSRFISIAWTSSNEIQGLATLIRPQYKDLKKSLHSIVPIPSKPRPRKRNPRGFNKRNSRGERKSTGSNKRKKIGPTNGRMVSTANPGLASLAPNAMTGRLRDEDMENKHIYFTNVRN
eukprot:35677-Amorphochlora_amoeboformis.AAC.1